MSRQELVSAFLDGRISRRTLIRRLIAGGVSTGAAISYAQLLAPEHAGASPTLAAADTHYPLIDMTIVSTSLATVKAEGKLIVKVVGTEELGPMSFRVFRKLAGGGGEPIGTKHFNPTFTTKANGKQFAINVATAGFATLGSVRFYVHANGLDAERYPAQASAAATLS
jgi:hypothetical protein